LVASAGAADSRPQADHRADDPAGDGAGVEFQVEASAQHRGIRQCRRDVRRKGRWHDRIRVDENQYLALRSARARVHLLRPAARCANYRAAQCLRDGDAAVDAATVNDDDLRVRSAAAKRAQRARDGGRLIEHRHDYRKPVHSSTLLLLLPWRNGDSLTFQIQNQSAPAAIQRRIQQRRGVWLGRIALDDNPAALDLETALLKERDRVRKDAMLLEQDSRRQPLFVVAGPHGHRGLHDYRADIDTRSDEENGASCYLDAVFDRVLRPVNAGKRRQQAVVDIHDAAGERLEHHGREQAHEARQRDQFDRAIAQRGEDRAVEVLARCKFAIVDGHRLDSVAAGALESLRVGPIRYDETDFSLEIAAQDCVDYRLQIGAGAGNQDAEFDR